MPLPISRNNCRPITVVALCLAITGCNPQRFFYFPTQKLYLDPTTVGLQYDIVHYHSLNGKQLYALFFRTSQRPKGTVVHFHGNYGNVSNHFPLSVFLLKRGFDVLIFDYEGYGASQGRPTAKRTVDDGVATIRFAQQTLRDRSTGVVVFGQSLGGAIATVATAKEPLARAVVIEAAFKSYSSMGRAVLRRRILTWPFAWVLPLFLSHSYDPEDWIDQIAPRPVFIIHGDRDKTVPVAMSQALFDQAKEPKRIWIVEGADHLERRPAGVRYEEAISEFFETALKPSKNTAQH
jgi:uncharacterized protein